MSGTAVPPNIIADAALAINRRLIAMQEDAIAEMRRRGAEIDRLTAENARLRADNARLRAALGRLHEKAIEAVEHVAMANYPPREKEALDMIRAALKKTGHD